MIPRPTTARTIEIVVMSLRGWLVHHGVQVSVICPGYIYTPMTEINNFPMPFIMHADKAACIIQRVRTLPRKPPHRQLVFGLPVENCEPAMSDCSGTHRARAIRVVPASVYISTRRASAHAGISPSRVQYASSVVPHPVASAHRVFASLTSSASERSSL